MWGWSFHYMPFPDSLDPAFFAEPDPSPPYQLTVSPDSAHPLYESDDLRNWAEVDPDIKNGAPGTVQDYEYVDGTYYVFLSVNDETTDVIYGDSLTDLGDRKTLVDWPDCGTFYDEEDDRWHIYTEGEPYEDEPCSDYIRHYTADDPLGPYEFVGYSIDVSDREWHTGDVCVDLINGQPTMWMDRSVSHPEYHLARAESDDLHNFEVVDDQCTYTQGGDLCIGQLEDGQYVGFTEFTAGNNGGVGVWRPCNFSDGGVPIPFSYS